MTIVDSFFSQTILQKSSTVFCIGPVYVIPVRQLGMKNAVAMLNSYYSWITLSSYVSIWLVVTLRERERERRRERERERERERAGEGERKRERGSCT